MSKMAPIHVALLRGINVGGHRKIRMSELVAVCHGLGWLKVQSYLQSGNVVFQSAERPPLLEHALEMALQKQCGLETQVMVRSMEQWKAYLEPAPFEHVVQHAPGRVLLFVPKHTPDPSAVKALQHRARDGEEAMQVRDGIWIYFPAGSARTKLTPPVMERSIGAPVTGRNWNTVHRIATLCEAMLEP